MSETENIVEITASNAEAQQPAADEKPKARRGRPRKVQTQDAENPAAEAAPETAMEVEEPEMQARRRVDADRSHHAGIGTAA